MLKILYEDRDVIVVVKPAGVEAQSARRFAPDMVSEIRKHLVINKICTKGKEPYVAVIHRLDKPVSGIMVYGLTKKAAAALSEQVQNRKMEKCYEAVVCGKPVENVDKFVDYLRKSVDGNYSQVVEKGISDAKRAELSYEVKGSAETEAGPLTLVRIRLTTGRHHQIRVQFAAHGLPLYGDGRYNPAFGGSTPPKTGAETRVPPASGREAPLPPSAGCQAPLPPPAGCQAPLPPPAGCQAPLPPPAGCQAPLPPSAGRKAPLALCAVSLAFVHPTTGKRMEFAIRPAGDAFEKFYQDA